MPIYENKEMGISLTVNIGELRSGTLLYGKTVLITGATGGIGSAIAKKCVNQGAQVILAGQNKRKLELLKQELGARCEFICFDIRDISCFDDQMKLADTFFGNIDCLVNNAGISLHEGSFMNVTEETWDSQLDVNLKAPYFLTQSWLRYYREKGIKSGRVLMMASDTSGMGCSTPYGLSKVALASLTHGLAKQLITEGVRINAVAPGTTMTPMTDDVTHGEVCRETTQGKRTLFPEEIAELCVFLLSDLSTCVSGNIFGCSEANICFDNIHRELETNP
jgi:NAD(P)-dependent dehydrogenase (short-subunit alcohol dehydrogenase family)